mgnify:CR=1 FL=1
MITIRLMGGLGNQMFQYAALRTAMIDFKDNGTISLAGITNKTHNVYALNHFNLSKKVLVSNKKNIKCEIVHLIYGLYYLFLIKKTNGFEIMKKWSLNLNEKGMYCVPDGYIPLKDSNSKNKAMVGYFQSVKYFEKYQSIISKELTVKDKIKLHNVEILKKIKHRK